MLVVNTVLPPAAKQQIVPLEAYLRGLGKLDLADQLRAQVLATDDAFKQLDLKNLDTVQHVSSTAGALKKWMENNLAPALNLAVQFSSADGD